MPPRLVPLVEYGVIDHVIRPLLSGKEAQVYLVEAGGERRAAKVYKAATERTFRNRSDYTEGRSVRNSRDQRAMGKRSRHGRKRDEASWNAAEADTIYKLDAAGVRVPRPYAFVDGVLVMECIEAPDGGPAPRLAESPLEGDQADVVFHKILREVVKMLSVDIVHGDLSVFNVLIEQAGPVIIDFPQAIDAAQNRNAKRILLRDVANITAHFRRGRPARELRYAHEMWALYERGELRPDSPLTGRFKLPKHEVDAERLLMQMREIEEDEVLARRSGDFTFTAPTPGARFSTSSTPRTKTSAGPRRRRKAKAASPGPQVVIKGRSPIPAAVAATPDPAPKRRRRRRRRSHRGPPKAE